MIMERVLGSDFSVNLGDYSFECPLSNDMQRLSLSEFSRTNIDWRFLTSVRPEDLSEQDMIGSLIEITKCVRTTVDDETTTVSNAATASSHAEPKRRGSFDNRKAALSDKQKQSSKPTKNANKASKKKTQKTDCLTLFSSILDELAETSAANQESSIITAPPEINAAQSTLPESSEQPIVTRVKARRIPAIKLDAELANATP